MDVELWKKKRRKTLYVYLLYALMYGTDYTLASLTIIPYLENLVKTERPQLYYSVSFVVYSIVSAIANILIGRVVDHSRNVKHSMYMCTCFGIVGNLVYTIYYSPIVPVLGRALCGIFSAEIYVLRGEMIRCYNEEESSRVQWWYTASFSTGYVIGSWISLTFVNINFNIGPLIINQHNFVGLFMSTILILNMIIIYIFCHDCSKEYDLKAVLYTQQKNSNESTSIRAVYKNESEDVANTIPPEDMNGDTIVNMNRTTTPHNNKENYSQVEQVEYLSVSSISTRVILSGFMRNPEIILIMTSSFLFAGIGYTIDLLNPIIVLNVFKWNEEWLDIPSALSNAVYFLALLLLSKICITTIRIYKSTLCCIVSTIICLALLIVVMYKHLGLEYQIILFVAFTTAYEPVWLLDSVTLPIMLGKMVPSNIQCFSESVRSSISLCSCIVSGIVIATETGLKYWLSFLVFCALVSLLRFVIRHKKLRNTEVIQFKQTR